MDHVFSNDQIRRFRMPPKLPADDEVWMDIRPYRKALFSMIPRRLEALMEREDKIVSAYQKRMRKINSAVACGSLDSISEYFWSFFAEMDRGEVVYIQKWIKYWLRLYEIARETKVLPEYEVGEGGVDRSEIRRAKEYPIEDLFDGELQHRGNRFLGVCPFHDEKTPSFTIFTNDNHWHCFGCGAHGDAMDFLMKEKNIDLPTAVKELINA